MDVIVPGVEGGAGVILPSLRGYETRLDDPGLRFMCRKCRCLRVLYRSVAHPMMQRVFPALCLRCGKMVKIEVKEKK
jgi:hypothetical protein